MSDDENLDELAKFRNRRALERKKLTDNVELPASPAAPAGFAQEGERPLQWQRQPVENPSAGGGRRARTRFSQNYSGVPGNSADSFTVVLFDESGADLGAMSMRDARQLASDRGLEVFIVNTDASVPRVQMMDYGRYKFESERRSREMKRRHHVGQLKDVKLRLEIAQHDYTVKLRGVSEFLQAKERVRISITIGSNESERYDQALSLMQKMFEDLKVFATLEQEPWMDSKTVMMMVLSPVV